MRQQQLDNMQLTTSKPSVALWWWEERGVFPPSAPYPRESLLARRLPYKLSLVISYVTLCTFMLIFLVNFFWHWYHGMMRMLTFNIDFRPWSREMFLIWKTVAALLFSPSSQRQLGDNAGDPCTLGAAILMKRKLVFMFIHQERITIHYIIVNWVEWLWNPSDSFVICFCGPESAQRSKEFLSFWLYWPIKTLH